MKRQPNGIPAGGQFAADRKGEPTSTLGTGGLSRRVPEFAGKREQARFQKDTDALEATGLRGDISVLSFDYSEDSASLRWTSPAGNVIDLHGTNEKSQKAAVAFANKLPLRGGTYQPWLPAHNRELGDGKGDEGLAESMAMRAQHLNKAMNTARAWRDAGVQETPGMTVDSLEFGDDEVVISAVDGLSEQQFTLRCDTSTGKVTGSVESDDETWPLHESEVMDYASRITKFSQGAREGDDPAAVLGAIAQRTRARRDELNAL